jgi:hypothetical protein
MALIRCECKLFDGAEEGRPRYEVKLLIEMCSCRVLSKQVMQRKMSMFSCHKYCDLIELDVFK